MDWEIDDKNLLGLYEMGTAKKYRLPPGLAEKFVDRVNRIDAAVDIHDLRDPPSMNFEKLRGSSNRFSLRLNRQYRLELEIDFEDREKTRGKVRVLKISKHYR